MFSRFFQYVVFLNFSTKLGISLVLSDYDNNVENALMEYIQLEEKKWELEDRKSIMRILDEIAGDKTGEKAELVIKDHVPA